MTDIRQEANAKILVRRWRFKKYYLNISTLFRVSKFILFTDMQVLHFNQHPLLY